MAQQERSENYTQAALFVPDVKPVPTPPMRVLNAPELEGPLVQGSLIPVVDINQSVPDLTIPLREKLAPDVRIYTLPSGERVASGPFGKDGLEYYIVPNNMLIAVHMTTKQIIGKDVSAQARALRPDEVQPGFPDSFWYKLNKKSHKRRR